MKESEYMAVSDLKAVRLVDTILRDMHIYHSTDIANFDRRAQILRLLDEIEKDLKLKFKVR